MVTDAQIEQFQSQLDQVVQKQTYPTPTAEILNTLTHACLASSERPIELFSTVAAMHTLASICVDRVVFKIGGREMMPKMYSIFVAKSGFGKDAPLKFPHKALSMFNMFDKIGEEGHHSDSSLTMMLKQKPYALDAWDEFGSILSEAGKAGGNVLYKKWVDQVNKLYSKGPGEPVTFMTTVADKKANGGQPISVGEVGYSLLGGGTFEHFNEWKETGIMFRGLLSRITVYSCETFEWLADPDGIRSISDQKNDLITALTPLSRLIPKHQKTKVSAGPEFMEVYKLKRQEFDKMAHDFADEDDEISRQLYSRAIERALPFALLHCLGRGSIEPSVEDLEFGCKWIEANIWNITPHMRPSDDSMRDRISEVLGEYTQLNPIKHRDLYRKVASKAEWRAKGAAFINREIEEAIKYDDKLGWELMQTPSGREYRVYYKL